jgi:hypothetical protein
MSCILGYYLSVSGDCSQTNSGAFTVYINGSAPDYTIDWVSPLSGTTALGAGVTAYTVTNLSAGTYSFNIIDSCSPTNMVQPVNVYISSGTCISIDAVLDTTCGNDNGSLTASTTNVYNTANFYLYDDISGYVTSGTSISNTISFNSLSAGSYYVIANDGGGCTGRSESTFVKSSSTFDYGFYVVENAGCAENSGKIYVTGETGNPPYTYLWSNGETSSSITGLSAGIYSVTITDNTNCSVTKSATVLLVPPVGIGTLQVTGPACFENNGTVTVVITGGTAPFYYSGSNGFSDYSFDRTYTFGNIGVGNFLVSVTDAGLCTTSAATYVLTPLSFDVVSITTNNSLCNNNDGSIDIQVVGGTPPYVYTLYKDNTTILQQTTNSVSWSFGNLSGGTYSISIEDGGPCSFSNTYTITNETLFNISLSGTPTTCGYNNGTVTIEISGGTPPYTYSLNDGLISTTSLTSITYNNLTYGEKTIVVTDNTACSQTSSYYVGNSQGVNFVYTTKDSTGNDNGEITAYILEGTPPFNIIWSDNVSGQSGTTLVNLAPDNYELTITDSANCSMRKVIYVGGTTTVVSYQTYEGCSNKFTNSGELIQRGPLQMTLEGFYDLTSGYTDCILNSSLYEASVTIGDNTSTNIFYSSTNLYDVPSDELWAQVVSGMILEQDGIADVTYDLGTNLFTITTQCGYEDTFQSKPLVNKLNIYYDISCVQCEPPIYYFSNCDDATLIYSNDVTGITSGKTYIFQEIESCWTSCGTTTTYDTLTTLTINSEYDDCMTCGSAVDYFVDCSEPSNTIYVNPTTSLTIGSVYRFNEIDGCWTYSGATDVYDVVNSYTINSTFDNCSACTEQCSQYLGHDEPVINCTNLSVDFFVTLSGPVGCINGTYGGANCPPAIVQYTINGNTSIMNSNIWGVGSGVYEIGPNCSNTQSIETVIPNTNVYDQQTIIIDYVITYPTPEGDFTFTETIEVYIPGC